MRTRLLLSVSICVALAAACSRDEPAAPAAPAAPADATAAAAAAPAAQERVFKVEELDQMLAPIALYPDPLLAQVLMAATYPGDIADAVKWSTANPEVTGDAAVVAVQTQPWDPSVQALVAFPQALAVLGQDPGWVQRLGDAFLAQPEDVMDSVQRLRRQAQDAGNLASNEFMKVTSEPAPAPAASADPGYADGGDAYSAGSDTTIIIEPAQADTVYVPAYDPASTYGSWAYPSYPPTYYPPAYGWYPGQALWTGLAFGTGIAIADSLWGDMDWGGDDIDIDVDRYNNVNVNDIDRNSNKFEHNAANRDGVPYRDQANRGRDSQRLDGSERRNEFRGDDPGRAQARETARQTAERGGGDAGRDRQREQARQSMADRGVDTPARSTTEARDRARDASAQQPALADRGGAGARDGGGRADAGPRDASGGRGGDSYGSAGNAGRSDPRTQRASQTNTQARDSARSSQRQQPRNDAFSGASRPQQSRTSYDRGRQSQQSAQRSSQQRSSGGSRSSGQQMQRSSSRSSGGSRSSSGGGRRR